METMKRRHMLGSSAWLEEMFQSEPARDPTGRSRPTQRYLTLQSNGAPSVAEGGNTATARSLLMTMTKAGLVKRLKLEPFALNKANDGIDAIPDIAFQTHDGRVFVVETKASKYLTKDKLAKQLQVESVVTQSGMTYLFWTDSWPLTSVLWRQMRETRRLGTSEIPREQILEVADAISSGPKSLNQLRQVGLYRPYVLAAVWLGQAHVDLFSQFSEETLVSNDPKARQFDRLLSASVSSYQWWSTLTESRNIVKANQ